MFKNRNRFGIVELSCSVCDPINSRSEQQKARNITKWLNCRICPGTDQSKMSKEAGDEISANKILADGSMLAATKLCRCADVSDMLNFVTVFCNVGVKRTILKC